MFVTFTYFVVDHGFVCMYFDVLQSKQDQLKSMTWQLDQEIAD